MQHFKGHEANKKHEIERTLRSTDGAGFQV